MVVETPKGEFEIPFIDAFIKKVNYVSKTVEAELPFGLLGEDTADERDGHDDANHDDDQDDAGDE